MENKMSWREIENGNFLDALQHYHKRTLCGPLLNIKAYTFFPPFFHLRIIFLVLQIDPKVIIVAFYKTGAKIS